jgi:hypothetical protein
MGLHCYHLLVPFPHISGNSTRWETRWAGDKNLRQCSSSVAYPTKNWCPHSPVYPNHPPSQHTWTFVLVFSYKMSLCTKVTFTFPFHISGAPSIYSALLNSLKTNQGQAQWLMCVIPAIQEVEIGGSWF